MSAWRNCLIMVKFLSCSVERAIMFCLSNFTYLELYVFEFLEDEPKMNGPGNLKSLFQPKCFSPLVTSCCSVSCKIPRRGRNAEEEVQFWCERNSGNRAKYSPCDLCYWDSCPLYPHVPQEYNSAGTLSVVWERSQQWHRYDLNRTEWLPEITHQSLPLEMKAIKVSVFQKV